MPGTVVTLRPNETFNGGDWWTITGGPTTVHAATADSLDTTFAVTTGSPAFLGFGDLAGIPPGARIISVAIRVRWVGDGTAMGAVATVDNLNGKYAWQTSYYKVPATPRTETWAAMTTRPDGTPWTLDAVNHITVRIAGNATTVKFFEAYADVTYNERATVSDVGPSGTITGQQPAVTWNYGDPDADPQERWRVRVFSGAAAGAPGFNPETARAVADSGSAYYSASGAAAWTVPAALSPGVYHAYVRAADAGSGGRWSDWASSTFTVVGDPPAPPALLSVTPDPARGRVEIRARQTDNLLNQQTATGDGIANEYLRWYAYGNVTTPTTTSGGLTGNCVTASVIANGEAAITGVQLLRVIPGLTHIWAGWIKADTPGGAIHLDIAWFDAAKSFIRMDEGGVVGLSTSYEASEGRGEAPDNATWAHLMWRSSGPLAAGQDLFWDDCGVWFTRTDPLLGDLESRLIAAEDAVVDLEIRVAELEGVPPVISIHPTRAPIDATAYRGGLDSGNLLGPADASFIYTLVGTRWTLAGPGSLATAPDDEAYEGYSLRVLPGSTGTGRRLTLTSLPLPPQVGASYQFSFRCRAIGDGLRCTATLSMLDGNDAAVRAVSVGVTLDETVEFSAQTAVTITRPDTATRFSVDLYLDGESSTDDRWIFDQFQVVRMPLTIAPQGFGVGPFGVGPFGGTINGQAGRAPTLTWKPASQVDVYPLVEWSVDDGDTWTPVRHTDRAAYDPVTRTAVVYDYEAPIGKPIMYRARTVARDFQTDPVAGALLVSAPTTTRTVTLSVDGYYIVDPYSQKRLPFNIATSSGAPELRMTRPIPRGEFSPYGADYKVLVYDRAKGNEFDWRIALESHAAWDEFDALLASGHTLLVQAPIGKSWYIRPSDWKPTVPLEGARDMGAVIEFSGYEQPRPV